MKLNLKQKLLPSLMAASLAGITLVPAQPANADDRVLRDAAIGAGVNVVTGAVTGCGSVLGNAGRGALTGAAVNGANGLRNRRNRRDRNLALDLGVGTGAGIVGGKIVGGCNNTLNNAIGGGATGGVIHILDRNGRR